MKVYVIKILSGILVIVNECNKPCNISEYLDYKNCKCKKRLVNKLVEECNETIDEVKLTLEKMKIAISINFAYCTLFCFQYFFYNQYCNWC